jgi:hypothetical protein
LHSASVASYSSLRVRFNCSRMGSLAFSTSSA